jgi:ankyrin repeat protein
MVRAIKENDLDAIRQLIDAEPVVVNRPISDPTDEATGSPLCYAAQVGRVEAARMLIQRGADVNWSQYAGVTPLHYAATHGHSDVAQLLIDHGTDIEAGSPYNTPLQAAARGTEAGCSAVLAMLEHKGAKLDLHTAVYLGRTVWVREYVQQNPEALSQVSSPESLIENAIAWVDRRLWREAEDKQDRQAIARIISDGRDLIELLLDAGTDPNAGTALVQAIQLPDTAIAKLLLQRGADPNHDKDTAMMIIEAASSDEMRALLKRYGARDNSYSYEDTLSVFRRLLGGDNS